MTVPPRLAHPQHAFVRAQHTTRKAPASSNARGEPPLRGGTEYEIIPPLPALISIAVASAASGSITTPPVLDAGSPNQRRNADARPHHEHEQLPIGTAPLAKGCNSLSGCRTPLPRPSPKQSAGLKTHRCYWLPQFFLRSGNLSICRPDGAHKAFGEPDHPRRV